MKIIFNILFIVAFLVILFDFSLRLYAFYVFPVHADLAHGYVFPMTFLGRTVYVKSFLNMLFTTYREGMTILFIIIVIIKVLLDQHSRPYGPSSRGFRGKW